MENSCLRIHCRIQCHAWACLKSLPIDSQWIHFEQEHLYAMANHCKDSNQDQQTFEDFACILLISHLQSSLDHLILWALSHILNSWNGENWSQLRFILSPLNSLLAFGFDWCVGETFHYQEFMEEFHKGWFQ